MVFRRYLESQTDLGGIVKGHEKGGGKEIAEKSYARGRRFPTDKSYHSG